MKKSILITLGIVLSQGLSEAATGGYGYDDYEDAKVISCYFTKKDIIKEGLKEDGINV